MIKRSKKIIKRKKVNTCLIKEEEGKNMKILCVERFLLNRKITEALLDKFLHIQVGVRILRRLPTTTSYIIDDGNGVIRI